MEHHKKRVPQMAPKSNPNAPATTQNGEMTVRPPTPFQEMLRTMSLVAQQDQQTAGFSGDDLNAILSAETEEEMWEADERGPLNFQHLAGCEIAIIDLTVKYSRGGSAASISTPFVAHIEMPDGSTDTRKMYFLVKAVRVTGAGEKKLLRLPPVGEEFEANTSARFVAAKLWWFYSKGMIDSTRGKSLMCRVEETDLGDGTGVLKLKPLTPAPVSATAE